MGDYLACNKVPLSIPTWPDVLDFVLDTIWVVVLRTFDGEITRSIVMESINKKWCNHKSELTSNVIHRFLDNEKFRLDHPKELVELPKNCRTIKQDWQAIVKFRDTLEFRVSNYFTH